MGLTMLVNQVYLVMDVVCYTHKAFCGGVCVQGCSAVAAPQVCHIMITLMNKKTCAIPIHMLCVILFMPLTFWVSFLPVPN
jgi:hypothetical protein